MDLNEILGYLFSYGIPIVAVLGVLLLIVVSMGLAISWHKYLVFGYLVVVLVVAQSSSFGTLDGGNSNIVWVKGTKTFFFSFLDMLIFGTWILSVVLMSFWTNKSEQLKNPLAKWYVAFGLLFCGYIIVAMFGKEPLLLEFGQRGVINVLWQGMLISLLFTTLQTEKDIKRLTWIIVICLGGREAFGLLRYLFLGGDPQNYYANYGFVNVKMTFWDINDSVLASLLMGFAMWKVLAEKLGNWERFAYGLLGIMAALTPALTSRRTAQGGLLLAMILLYFLLPRGRKFPVLIALSLVIPLTLTALIARSGDSAKPIMEKILLDIKMGSAKKDSRDDRFYELMVAWKSVKEEPFFGVGPSGSFKVNDARGLEYHSGKYDFVHSGFGHILLKTGFIGLFIFLSIYGTFLIHVKRGWKLILPEHKALAVGAMCGFVAMIPTLTNGAPVIEIRTMQVIGFTLALPLIFIAHARRKVADEKKSTLHEESNLSHFQPTVPLAIRGKKK